MSVLDTFSSSFRESVESVCPLVNMVGDTVLFFKHKTLLNSRLSILYILYQIYCINLRFICTETKYSLDTINACTAETASTDCRHHAINVFVLLITILSWHGVTEHFLFIISSSCSFLFLSLVSSDAKD